MLVLQVKIQIHFYCERDREYQSLSGIYCNRRISQDLAILFLIRQHNFGVDPYIKIYVLSAEY